MCHFSLFQLRPLRKQRAQDKVLKICCFSLSVKSLEKAKSTGQFAVTGSVNARSGTLTHFDELESDSEENNATVAKKLKLS